MHLSNAWPIPRISLFVAGMVLGLSTLSFFRIPLLPDIRAELELDAVQVGAITVAFAFGRLVTDLPAGRYADRVPPMTSYMVAGLVLSMGGVMLGVASTPSITWLAAFVIGIGSSISNTTGVAYFSRIGNRTNRGRYMAIFSTVLLGGQSLGPALGGIIAGLGSWRLAQLVAAVAAGLMAAASFVLGRRRTRSSPSPLRAPLRLGEDAETPASPPATRAARIEIAVILLIAFSVFFTTGGMTQTLIPLIGGDALTISTSAIGLALGMGGLWRLIGGLVGGFVADKRSRRTALVPGLLLPMAGVLVLAFWVEPAGWLLAIALVSAGSVGLSTAGAMLGDRTGPANSGRAFGRFRFIGDLGLMTGPLVSTLLYSEVGYKAPLLLTAALLLAATLAGAFLLSEHPR